ncbi:MAG: TolC family protein [Campylobacterales bacterium]|nr:TolC family protein [Campylobacterales bacterium]
MLRIIMVLLLNSFLIADELTLLHEHKKTIQEKSKEEIEATYKTEKNDWVSPVNLSLSSSKSSTMDLSQKAALSLSQDIYRFGGIKYQISYAKANRRYKLTDLKLENSSYYKTIYNTILEIRKIKLQLQQTRYQLRNKELEIQIQKSKYQSGSGDIILLNSAIMDKNTQLQSIINLKNALVTYQKELYKITPISESKIALPHFRIINAKKFLDKNYELKLAKMQSDIKKAQLNLTKSSYYPRVTLSGEVGYQKNENYGVTQFEDDYYSVGVHINIPLDFNRKSSVEAKKLAYMREVLNEQDTKIEQEALYKQIIGNIQNYQSYQTIIGENIKLYQEILQTAKKGYKVGYKSGYDYKIMKNTYQVHQLEVKLYDLYIQQELLKLHFAVERG